MPVAKRQITLGMHEEERERERERQDHYLQVLDLCDLAGEHLTDSCAARFLRPWPDGPFLKREVS